MSFKIQDMGIAASVYLALYAIYTSIAIYAVIKKGFKTLYTALLIYGLIRLGGQISGLGFAVNGYAHWQWLIAYVVLTAEGYFTLVLTSFYVICKEQRIKWGSSPYEQKMTIFKYVKLPILSRILGPSLKKFIHKSLVPANAILIAGGTMLTGMTVEELATDHLKVLTSKVLRTVGQSFFLGQSTFICCLAVYNYRWKGLNTLPIKALLFITPFLLVRGIFGVMSIYITSMNYFVISNYFSETAHQKMTIYEYVLSTTMEFISATTLLNTIWYDLRRSEPEIVSDSDKYVENLAESKV